MNTNECKNKNKIKYIIITMLIILVVAMGIYIYKQENEYVTASQNAYNSSFYQMIGYVQSMENYLAKATISTSPEHGAETLTEVWKDANLAAVYLSQLPITTESLSNTAKFLNQVSDYSYSLSRKNINNENLTQEDLDNLGKLHEYSIELENTLNELGMEMSSGVLSWRELTKSNLTSYAKQVDNVSFESFSNIEQNFNEYAGLIYDGAYSEHINKVDKKGLTGEEVDEEKAKQNAKEFIDENKIKEINSNGYIENADIPFYDFTAKTNNDEEISIAISKKGGHVIYMNYVRDVSDEKISQDEANNIGKEFLTKKGFDTMKETYYMKEGGTVTVNYAYEQNGIVVYPDLIKLKIALDNGEILGIETSGYLNSHEERNVQGINISMDEAKKTLNPKLEIMSEEMAIIPTKWKTEILCYEFKGKVDDTEFLVYVNAGTGKEENILVILDTPNGTLTM